MWNLPEAIPRDRIHELCAKADIFINASRSDNMPVSILEAFASGLPVATSSDGGILDMVTHGITRLLSEVGDCENLAKNVIRLLRDPALAQALAENSSRKRWRLRQVCWGLIDHEAAYWK